MESTCTITDILGSIDKKIEIYKKQQMLLDKFSAQIYEAILSTSSNNVSLKQIASISTGKEDANFSQLNGTIPFFTCGQSILKCPQAAFYGKAVLIAGNGDFNVKHYEGKFNAYQRTYVLQPANDNLYGTLFYACSYYIGAISKRSAGSIVKFITKSDIENIQIPIAKNIQLHNVLNQNIKQLDKIANAIETLINHKNQILPLLMNGQAVVC